MLWLTELKQTGNDIVIDGKCMVLTSLSDFVGNLEASGYFKKSVEILNSQAEPSTAAGNLIKFSIKAQFQPKG
jgi:Tfp pilus assembly protein PilN